MRPGRWVALAALSACSAPALHAQGYSLRLDSRIQHVDYRGVAEDSVLESQTVIGPTGGPVTTDGFAVSCDPGGRCSYFRPGPVIHATPLAQSVAFTAWGFGITGLSFHGEGRLLTDLSSVTAWAGTEPAAQLLEAYAAYITTPITVQLGRQTMLGRLGSTGFDGAQVTFRAGHTGLDLGAYAGWGLARATALPITSPALNPLDEYRPTQRTRLYGASVGYSGIRGNARLDYQRELDGRSSYFVSERAALSADTRVGRHLMLAGGGEYDIAAGLWGTADIQARYVMPVATVALSARHYRPHFDLWTIWGAFSPVPFNSVSGAVWVRPRTQVEIRARAERYWFERANASTPLVSVEDAGWRASVGATVSLTRVWRTELDAHREFGPGAASRGLDLALIFAPRPDLELRATGAALQRPLEFRYDDASVSTLGLDADWAASERIHAGLGLARYWETRDRPDAAAFDWAQTRLNARLTLLFGGAGALPLPPARRRSSTADRTQP